MPFRVKWIGIQRVLVVAADRRRVLLRDVTITHGFADHRAILAFGQRVVVGLARTRAGELDAQLFEQAAYVAVGLHAGCADAAPRSAPSVRSAHRHRPAGTRRQRSRGRSRERVVQAASFGQPCDILVRVAASRRAFHELKLLSLVLNDVQLNFVDPCQKRPDLPDRLQPCRHHDDSPPAVIAP